METPEAAAPEFDAVLLAGGCGTRLASLPGDLPKPLRPVAGRPFLDRLIDQVRAVGSRRIVLSIGHRADAFRPYGERGIRLSAETSPLGTGGGLRQALRETAASTLLVLNGDSYASTDLGALLRAHRRRAARATILLARVEDVSRFGRVETGPAGEIRRFVEKGERGPGEINAGVYALQREAVEEIPEGRPVSLEREVFPSWIGRGFYAVAGAFPFIDIGTPESYEEAGRFFAGPTAGP